MGTSGSISGPNRLKLCLRANLEEVKRKKEQKIKQLGKKFFKNKWIFPRGPEFLRYSHFNGLISQIKLNDKLSLV